MLWTALIAVYALLERKSPRGISLYGRALPLLLTAHGALVSYLSVLTSGGMQARGTLYLNAALILA